MAGRDPIVESNAASRPAVTHSPRRRHHGAYESLLRPVLFRLDPELVHNLTIRACEVGGRWRIARRLAERAFLVDNRRLRTRALGLDLANPLGLAAGFDKNGRAVSMLSSLGFGHVEIGSVSAHPSIGNPRPRLFRLPQDGAVVVNYGVPNDGAVVVAERLRHRRGSCPLGINLVKTNDPARPAIEPEVYDDFVASMGLLEDRADYIALSLSCPNSPGDRDFFDDTARLHSLLERLAELSPAVPVVLKLKPTGDAGALREIVAIADGFAFVTGIAINLPSGKPAHLRLVSPPALIARMPGAVSGRPAEDHINGALAQLYGIVGPRSRYTLFAAGGVFTAEDAYRKIRLGASLVQVYTGLIYRGPHVVKEILLGLVGLLERDGFANVAEAVGTGALPG